MANRDLAIGPEGEPRPEDIPLPEEDAPFDQLCQELAQLKVLVSKMGNPQEKSPVDKPQIVYLSQGPKLSRFRGRPQSKDDPLVEEWVADAQNMLATRKSSPSEGVALLLEHLSGEARQEIVGRGQNTTSDPELILGTLLSVFGGGETLGHLQQKFFSYHQTNEDLLTCSLTLVSMCERLCAKDASFSAKKTSLLKERFADAVKDENLRRELTRLNLEQPHLDFFGLRDRAITWAEASTSPRKGIVSSHEVGAEDLRSLVERQQSQLDRQAELLSQQQKMLETLASERDSRSPKSGFYKDEAGCYSCGLIGHFWASCPNRPRGPRGPGANRGRGRRFDDRADPRGPGANRDRGRRFDDRAKEGPSRDKSPETLQRKPTSGNE